MKKRLLIKVTGRVQRVGYRDTVAEIGRKLKIIGTVKNARDPSIVEIIAEGEEENLKEFVTLIQRVKQPVEIEEIKIKEENPTGEFEYFEITRGDPSEELGERLDVAGGLLYTMVEKQDKMLEKQDKMLEMQGKMLEKQDMMLEKQDKMLEKQDKMLEKQDKMLEKQDKMLEMQGKMLEKQDMMLEKQDETLREIKGMRSDMVSRFDVMEKKYGKISEILERISIALETLAGLKPKY